MPATTDIEAQVLPAVNPSSNINPEGRSQPWKDFIKVEGDREEARVNDYITIHANEGDETGEFHDYAAQLG